MGEWTDRELQEIEEYAVKHGGVAAGKKFQITEARVSQLRKKLRLRKAAPKLLRRKTDNLLQLANPVASEAQLMDDTARILDELAIENARLRLSLAQAQSKLRKYEEQELTAR